MSRTQTHSRRLPTWAIQASIVLALALALEVAVGAGLIRRSSVAAPSAALSYLGQAAVSGELGQALVVTLFEIGVSFAIAAGLGVPLAFLFWRIPRLNRAFEPYLVSLYAMPLIFFYPLLLIVFGIGPLPIILLSILLGLTPIVLNTAAGLAQMRQVWLKVAVAMQATRRQVYLKVLLPGAAPLMFAGLRLAVIYIAIGVIAMEFLTGNAGVGYRARYFYSIFQVPPLYAYVLVIVLITLVLNELLARLEQRVRQEAT